ncbi:hypothetical protein AAFC00_007140 [Neodothiora populina]|uniref:Uncharacterized protein n=1 Tax=Neodothiora populina TaxID=2781224 RepID=A0ABR3PHD1_9PEZI
MASKGNTIEGWEPNPWTHAPNANVANAETMTSPQAQAARAKSMEIMAALKKGDKGDADRLMGSQETHDSLLPGVAKLKKKLLGKKPVQ